MNEPNPAPINLDELRLLPSWLREDAPPAKSYANHEGGDADMRQDRRGGQGGGNRGPRFGDRQGQGGGQNRGGGQGQGDRNRRPGGDRSQGGRSGPPPRGGSGGPRSDRRDDRRDDRRPSAPPAPPAQPAPVKVEFIPDDRCLASIVKQVRTRHMAYPLFGLARMFLQEPARHWVQFIVEPAAHAAGTTMYQLGEDGPVSMDRQTLEKLGYDLYKDQYYVEQTVQKDPPKGNFTSVARCRLSGTLLGPTSYHGYQLTLRSLYESRFSRRMSFEDYKRNVEVVNDPALVEKWKEDVRTVVTISTKEGEPPTVLNSPAEARAHFRQHYFDSLLKTGSSFRLPGSVAKDLADASMMASIRQAHEPELRYPAHFVQLLRQSLQNDGLHIFKHRKRFVYVSSARPTPFTGGGAVSENVAAILDVVGKNPLITRKNLAERILANKPAASPVAPGTAEKSAEPPAVPVASAEENSLVTPVDSVVEPTEPVVESATVAAPETEAETTAGVPVASAEETSIVTPADSVTEPTEPVAKTSESATASAEQPVSVTSEETAPVAANTTEISAAETPVPATPAANLPRDPQERAKAALAADLRFLVQAGHIIEFHNGTFDLPLPPKPKEEPRAQQPRPPRPNPNTVPPSAARPTQATLPKPAPAPEPEAVSAAAALETDQSSDALGEAELTSAEAEEAEALNPEEAVVTDEASDAPTASDELITPSESALQTAETADVKEAY